MAYIFHPNNTVGDIANQDVADALGDTGFICADALSNNTDRDHYDWVSLYELEVYNKWGQYQFCNDYPGYVCIYLWMLSRKTPHSLLLAGTAWEPMILPSAARHPSA